MKGLMYVVFLLFSLPNLIVGTAALVLRHTLATRNPLEIVTDFLFQVVWGFPLAGSLFLLLLIFGILSNTRPYTALFAFILNIVALVLVLSIFGFPQDFDQAIFFLPILLALIGFGWLAHPVFDPKVEAFRLRARLRPTSLR